MEIYLAETRIEHKLTQRELSRLSGVARSHISSIEAGEANPTIDVICKLAKALKVEPQNLFSCK